MLVEPVHGGGSITVSAPECLFAMPLGGFGVLDIGISHERWVEGGDCDRQLLIPLQSRA
jgi:hypothetical protein